MTLFLWIIGYLAIGLGCIIASPFVIAFTEFKDYRKRYEQYVKGESENKPIRPSFNPGFDELLIWIFLWLFIWPIALFTVVSDYRMVGKVCNYFEERIIKKNIETALLSPEEEIREKAQELSRKKDK